jgi:hypothetical protein
MRSRYNQIQLLPTLTISIASLGGAFILLIKNQNFEGAGFLFLLLLSLGAYCLVGFLKSAPLIYFNEKDIRITRLFQKTVYTWDQVNNVILTKQEIFSLSLPFGRNETMKLYFNDGKSLIIWSDAYSNMDEIRKFATKKTE